MIMRKIKINTEHLKIVEGTKRKKQQPTFSIGEIKYMASKLEMGSLRLLISSTTEKEKSENLVNVACNCK